MHLPYVDLLRGAGSVVKQFGKVLDSSPDDPNPTVVILVVMAGSINHIGGKPSKWEEESVSRSFNHKVAEREDDNVESEVTVLCG